VIADALNLPETQHCIGSSLVDSRLRSYALVMQERQQNKYRNWNTDQPQ